jgi:hypothetical protein
MQGARFASETELPFEAIVEWSKVPELRRIAAARRAIVRGTHGETNMRPSRDACRSRLAPNSTSGPLTVGGRTH